MSLLDNFESNFRNDLYDGMMESDLNVEIDLEVAFETDLTDDSVDVDFDTTDDDDAALEELGATVFDGNGSECNTIDESEECDTSLESILTMSSEDFMASLDS